MGFYGNTIYNTYGLQDKSVQPRHLDRNYWRWGRKIGVSSFQELRKKVLNLPKIDLNINKDTYFTEQDWKDCWAEAEKSMFAFHFSNNAKLRSVFGTSLILGWVLKETVTNKETTQYGPSYTMEGETSAYQYVLYMLCLGNTKRDLKNKPGSLFKIALNLTNDKDEDERIKAISDEIPEQYRSEGVQWVNNDFLVGPIISSSHLLKNSVIEEKIKDDAVTTNKIQDLNVTTKKIDNGAITPEKLRREHLEKVELWSTISTWTDFCDQVDFIGTDNTEDAPGGSLYFVLEVDAPMPPLYSNLPNKKIERGLAWAASEENHFILDCQNGRLWHIIKNSGNSGDNNVVPENGINYKIILQQIITEQVTNRAITPNKLDRDYLEKICLPNINGYDTLFNQIKNINTSTTSSNNPNESSTLYLVQNILLESLPNLYLSENSGYYISTNNSTDGYPYALGRSVVWRLTDTIYIISNTTGYTWKIDKVARTSTGSQVVDTGNVECKYSITLNTIPGNLIQNKSISTIKIADNAITRDKILDGEIITIKIADNAITKDKILEHEIEGGKYGHIKENTITSYNIADEAVTTSTIKHHNIEGGSYGHIKENAITSYNIADESITLQHFNIPPYNDMYFEIPSDNSNIPIFIDNSWRGGSKGFFNLGLNQIVRESMPLPGNSEFGSEKLETILRAIELRLPRNFGTIDSLSTLNEKALDVVNDPYIDHMTANLVISFRIAGGELTNLLGGGGSCFGTIDFDNGRCVRFMHMATGKVCQMVIVGGGTPSLSIVKE